jgi:hypothetical protein
VSGYKHACILAELEAAREVARARGIHEITRCLEQSTKAIDDWAGDVH